MTTTTEIDITAAVHAAGGRFHATMSRALWDALNAARPGADWLVAFALKLREVCRGRPALANDGLPAYTDVPDRRLFIFTTPGARAEFVVTVRVTPDGPDSQLTVIALGTADDAAALEADHLEWIEYMLERVKARRVGIRDDQILWRAVKPS